MLKCDKVAFVPCFSAVLPAIFHHKLANLHSLQNRLDKIPPPSREASALDCHGWHWSTQRRDDNSHEAVTDPSFDANPRWCGVDAETHKPAPEATVSCLTLATANNPVSPASAAPRVAVLFPRPGGIATATSTLKLYSVYSTLLYGACLGLAGAFGFSRLFLHKHCKALLHDMNAAPGLLADGWCVTPIGHRFRDSRARLARQTKKDTGRHTAAPHRSWKKKTSGDDNRQRKWPKTRRWSALSVAGPMRRASMKCC